MCSVFATEIPSTVLSISCGLVVVSYENFSKNLHKNTL